MREEGGMAREREGFDNQFWSSSLMLFAGVCI